MSAASRPVIAISPLPELRQGIAHKLAQSIEIAVEERMQHKPDRALLEMLKGEQRAFRAVLNDIDHMEQRT